MSGAAPTYLDVTRMGQRRLRELMLRGEPPDEAGLAGWEYRGTNMPATSGLLGLRRFIKGFVVEAGCTAGYNKQVRGRDLRAPWTPVVRRGGRAAYAPFVVRPVDPAAVDNRHLNALLVDYSAAPRPDLRIATRLRDYLTRVVPGSDDLLLGHAYFALGRRSVPIGWFVLERLGPADPS